MGLHVRLMYQFFLIIYFFVINSPLILFISVFKVIWMRNYLGFMWIFFHCWAFSIFLWKIFDWMILVLLVCSIFNFIKHLISFLLFSQPIQQFDQLFNEHILWVLMIWGFYFYGVLYFMRKTKNFSLTSFYLSYSVT